MKFGVRKPSLTRSFKARTTGRWKRAMKRAVIPGYGRRGMGWLHPKRAMYNRVYRRTTVSVWDIGKMFAGTGGRKRRSTRSSKAAVPVVPAIDWKAVAADVERRISLLPSDKQSVLEAAYGQQEIALKRVFLFWLCTGFVGGHRFYLHDYVQAVFMIIALYLFHWYALIWWVFDAMFLPSRVMHGNLMMKKALLEQAEDEVLSNILPQPSEVAMPESPSAAPMGVPSTTAGQPQPLVTATKAVAATLALNGISQFYPPDTEKFVMNDAEKIFFRNFFVHFASLGYPLKINVNRMSDGTLNFCYDGKQIGRVRLQKRKHTMQILEGENVVMLDGELPLFLENLPRWISYMKTLA